jgi:hypothetical protein
MRRTASLLTFHNDICGVCGYYYCYTKYFRQNFKSWTSGNGDVDKFIQDTQLSAHQYDVSKVLEWIPYGRFYNIEYIERIGIYKANLIDGNIIDWNKYNPNWKRNNKNMLVVLKNLNNPKNITLEFKDQVFLKYL